MLITSDIPQIVALDISKVLPFSIVIFSIYELINALIPIVVTLFGINISEIIVASNADDQIVVSFVLAI